MFSFELHFTHRRTKKNIRTTIIYWWCWLLLFIFVLQIFRWGENNQNSPIFPFCRAILSFEQQSWIFWNRKSTPFNCRRQSHKYFEKNSKQIFISWIALFLRTFLLSIIMEIDDEQLINITYCHYFTRPEFMIICSLCFTSYILSISVCYYQYTIL